MGREVKILAALLIVGHLFTELHSVVLFIDPNIKQVSVDLFLCNNFKFDLSLLWYIKMVGDDLLWCSTYYVMAKIAYKYSFTLFLVAGIYFIYHLIDSFLFLYNYKQTYWVYWSLLIVSVISILFIAFPIKKNKGIYKSMI